ncbi:Heat shock 70 kDa protein 12A [Terramyces sp. JEL0728]|nr:Heat shock 70 kDa protein 12A [Terramyces sp. JEL0728]
MITASIDMGTAYSGIAVKLSSTDKDYLTKTTWPNLAVPYAKDITSILYKFKNGKFEPYQFGTKAKSTYFNVQGNSEYFYVERFKLLLDPTNKQFIQLPPGVPLSQVLADFLRHMTETIKEVIQHYKGMVDNDIQWVVTVPAIWSPTAKAKTRQACFDCGMIDSLSSQKLLLCYEPQAASIFIYKNAPLKNDDEVIVTLDIGGGTTDITSHRVVGKNRDHNEVLPPVGALAGSSHIDDNFLEFVRQWVGPTTFDTVTQRNSQLRLKLVNNFAQFKLSLSSSDFQNDYAAGTIDLPAALIQQIHPQFRQAIANRQMQLGNPDILAISAYEMATFFDSVINQIVETLTQYIEQLIKIGAKPSQLLIVGGLAGSKYLTEVIRKIFEQKYSVTITVPADPGAAILKGAVDFGINPGTVSKRIWQHSFLLLYSKEFFPEQAPAPPNRRIFQSNGKWYHEEYHPYTTTGQEMPLNHVVSCNVSAPNDQCKLVRFELYSIQNASEQPKKVISCHISVPREYVKPGHLNSFRVELVFHPTEVILQVYHEEGRQYLSGNLVRWYDD